MSEIPRNRFDENDPRFRRARRLFERERADEARAILRDLARETWPGDTPALEIRHRPVSLPRPSRERLEKLCGLYEDASHLAEVLGVERRTVQRVKREMSRRDK